MYVVLQYTVVVRLKDGMEEETDQDQNRTIKWTNNQEKQGLIDFNRSAL